MGRFPPLFRIFKKIGKVVVFHLKKIFIWPNFRQKSRKILRRFSKNSNHHGGFQVDVFGFLDQNTDYVPKTSLFQKGFHRF